MVVNIIVIALIAIAAGFAIRSIVRTSKSSACGGCPYSGECCKCIPAQKADDKSEKCDCAMTQNNM